MKKSLLLFLPLLLSSSIAFAAGDSRVTYDVSGSSGIRKDQAYSEVHLGLNWFVSDYFNWRNSVFSQFGSEINTIYGLDSAALLNLKAYNSNKTLGVEFYIGPGVRLATEKSNAGFGKAGLTFSLAGIRIGGGVQALHYFEDRTDKLGNVYDKDEVQYFITLSGGGRL